MTNIQGSPEQIKSLQVNITIIKVNDTNVPIRLDVQPYIDFTSEPSRRIYKYGKLEMLYSSREERGQNYPTLHLQMGSHILDVPNLPDGHPAKYDTQGRELSLRVSAIDGPAYLDEYHMLTFDDLDFVSPVFPATLFEEIQHAANGDAIDTWLRNVDAPYPSFLPHLPAAALEYIQSNRVSSNIKWEDLRSVDPAFFAYRLANELPTKRLSLEQILAWCDGDVGKLGISDAFLAEELFITVLAQATNEDQLRYVGGNLANLPPHQTFDELTEAMHNRLLYLRGRIDPDLLDRFPGSQHNFFPNGGTQRLLNEVLS